VHKNLRAVARRLFALVFFGSALISIPSKAQTSPAVTHGVQWLSAQVQADGSLQNETQSIATPLQSRSEAFSTLKLLGSVSSAQSTAIAADTNGNTEYLARQIVTLSSAGTDTSILVSQLAASKNPDGGYGGAPGYVSTSLDTAFALIALKAGGQTAIAPTALAYLQATQQADGSFLFNGVEDIYSSIYVLAAFRQYSSTAQVSSNIQLATNYLMAQQSAPGIWNNSVFLTALVYPAVHDFIPLAPTSAAISAFLIANQQTDGSWGDDPYTTALVLRSLPLTTIAPANPALAQIKGLVQDAQTRLPLTGVVVTGTNGIALTSDATGSFIAQNLAVGTYQLSLTLSQYQTLNTSFTLQAGQVLDLGTLLMTKGGTATTGTVFGVIKDAASSQAISGVSISVNGAASAVTDATGSYQVSNVPAGSMTLQASKLGYATVSGSGTVAAGGSVIFSPVMTVSAGSGGGGGNAPTMQGVVLSAANNSPLAGVIISLSGSNTATATTNAQGQYSFSNLTTGALQITASLTGYDTVVANAQANTNGTINFSPKMYAIATTPVGQNASAVQGVVMDAGSSVVLPGVVVTLSVPGLPDASVTAGADGRFDFPGITAASVTLTANLPHYTTSVLQVPLEPLQTLDVGQIRLRMANVSQLLPDLQVTSASRMFAITDPQTLALSGNVVATIANTGTAPASVNFSVMAFSDVNGNGVFDAGVDTVLGSTVVQGGLATGANQTISIPVNGSLPYRDAPITILVDSTNAVIESNKANNVRSTAYASELIPTIANFDPVLKWQWNGSTVLPSSFNVIMMPVVAPLYDTNGDGKIDQNDTPSVAFISYSGAVGPGSPGVLRIISGKDGKDILTVTDPQYQLEGYSNLAIGDIDGSGHPVIIGLRSHTVGGGLVAFNADGTVRWTSPTTFVENNYSNAWGGVSIADLDGDGKAEIIYGNQVFNNDGTLRWTGVGRNVGQNIQGGWGSLISNSLSVVADINQDGNPVVLVGASAYDKSGTLLWKNDAVGDGFVAVANFTGATYPQIVVVSKGSVYLLDRSGNIIWGPVSIPGGGNGGPPTIADMDGDGIPEIGVAGGTQYTAYRADGSIFWTSHTQDLSSGVTGSTVFDFEGNGHAEVLYGDETTFRVYGGRDGTTLFSTPNPSGTAVEYPLVVDLDNGGHADILVVSNDYFSSTIHGVRAYQDRHNAWIDTRGIWNQHSYHITNVNDNGSVPVTETNSWTKGNNYRANLPSILYSCVAPVALLAETFTQPDSNVWTTLNGRGNATGSVVNGQYQVSGAGAFTVGSQSWGDYTAEVDLQFPNGATSDAGLAFRALNANQWYGLSVQSNSLNLVQYNQGTLTTLQQVPVQLSNDPTVIHSLKVQVVGTTVNAYLDNTLLITYSTLAWTQGAVGTQQGNVEAIYSAVKVTSYAPPFSQDVSASDLRVVDGGASPSTLTIRIGNSGSLNVPLGIPVSFYGIDAVSGQQKLLGTVNTTAVLQSGQYQDIQFTYASLSSITQLTVHANDDGTGTPIFQECDPSNNTVAIALPVLPGSFKLTAVATDQATYPANANVQIATTVANQGSFNGSAQVDFVIQTASGQPVAILPTQVIAVAPGGQKADNTVWNTNTFAPGTYTLMAQLLDSGGHVYNQLSTNFAITSGAPGAAQAGVTLTTDKQTYQSTDTVKLSDVLSNLTANTVLNGLTVVTKVINPSGATVLTQTAPLAQLVGAASKNYAYNLQLNGATPGVYTASVVVTASDGSTAATASTQFTVATSATTGSGLTGGITLSVQQVQIGNPLAITYSATNGGNSALTGLPLTVSIIDPVAQKVMASFSTTQTIAIGTSYAGSDSWTSAGTVGNNYVAVLSATIGGNPMTLAQANFTLIAPPIKLGITQGLWNNNTVLVLTACNDHGGDDHGGGDDKSTKHNKDGNHDQGNDGDNDDDDMPPHPVACTAARYVAIDKALTDLGLTHVMTTNTNAFTFAMRTGLYNTLWIASDQSQLGDDLTAEVSEVVYNGASLIVDSGTEQCTTDFDALGGVKSRHYLASNQKVTLSGSFYPTAQSLPTVGKAQSLAVTGSGQAQGSITTTNGDGDNDNDSDDKPQTDVALVSNVVGAGRTLIAGFDLGTTLSTQATAWKTPLNNTFAALMPTTSANLTPGEVLPLQTGVANQANAVAIDVQTILPTGALYLGSNPSAVFTVSTQTADWNFNLAVAQSNIVYLTMRAPGTGGSYNLQTIVSTVNNGTDTAYGKPVLFPITVTPAATTAAKAAAALQALTVTSKSDQSRIKDAIGHLNEAMTDFNLNTYSGYGKAIDELVEIADSLSKFSAANTAPINAIHAEIDQILQEAQWRWSMAQPEVNVTLGVDKTHCKPTDTIKLSENVTNITSMTVLNNLSVKTAVTDPTGASFFTKTETLTQFAVGEKQVYNYSIPMTNAALGNYAVSMTVVDANGNTLAKSSAKFSVAKSD
jgi:hypothetical protein